MVTRAKTSKVVHGNSFRTLSDFTVLPNVEDRKGSI